MLKKPHPREDTKPQHQYKANTKICSLEGTLYMSRHSACSRTWYAWINLPALPETGRCLQLSKVPLSTLTLLTLSSIVSLHSDSPCPGSCQQQCEWWCFLQKGVLQVLLQAGSSFLQAKDWRNPLSTNGAFTLHMVKSVIRFPLRNYQT